MAALLTSEAERGATAQIVKYIAECQVLGLEVLPPDINASDFDFIVEGRAVRFGLAAVKNVGETAARALIAVRRERGEFKTIFDVVRDADSRVVNRKVLESLIKAGAFDSLGLPRSRMFPPDRRADPVQPRSPEIPAFDPVPAFRRRHSRAAGHRGRSPVDPGVG